MIKVLLSKYLNIGINIEGARWSYHTTEMYDFLHMTGSQKANLSAVIQPKLRYTIDELKRLCDELNLSTSYNLLCSIGDEVPKTEREYMIYVTAIYAELDAKLFLYVPSHRATYYESENILSDGAKQAFPSACKEIREAGNCFATACYTASVFHAMRAVETGLWALGRELKITFPFPIELADWQNVIEKIESEIKKLAQLPKGTKRDEDQKFYSEAASHFRYFKDGWRVRVSHGRETYGEAQAYSVLNHSREFFETLFLRLSE